MNAFITHPLDQVLEVVAHLEADKAVDGGRREARNRSGPPCKRPGRRSRRRPHSSRPRAGSIEAALFLREFTGGRPWAHLDIAGAARASSDSGDVKGATGFGTRLLLAWLGALSSA